MRPLPLIISILAIVAGVLATLVIVVLCFAGTPNSSDAQLRAIYRYIALAGVGGLICMAAGIVLAVYRRYEWAGFIGGVPLLTLFCLIVWVALKS
ncbi:hypothetical protein BH10PLA1_BH10PLA1_03610 [soil metagenome]